MHTAVAHLQGQLKELQRNPVGGFAVEPDEANLFKWRIFFEGPPGSLYAPGIYRATMTFPTDFPFGMPPVLTINSRFYHPNVYEDGKVCMSLLHKAGTDEMNELETASMRWSPVVTVEKILIAFISLLSDPDPSEAGAPANVDALSTYRKNRDHYVKICTANAQQSLKEVPAGFTMPKPRELSNASSSGALQQQQQRQMTMMIVGGQHAADGAFEFDYGHPQGQSTTSSTGVSNSSSSAAAAAASSSSSNGNGNGQQSQSSQQQDFSSHLQRVKAICPEPPKSDAQIIDMLRKYKGDVDRVLEEMWD